MSEDGEPRPSGGTLSAYEPPSGPGVRVDGYGYAGYTTNPRFDSLLAKVIAHTPRNDMAAACTKLSRALAEFAIVGVTTNLPFLRALLEQGSTMLDDLHTGQLAETSGALVEAAGRMTDSLSAAASQGQSKLGKRDHTGARIDANDPLAVLAYGKGEGGSQGGSGLADADMAGPPGSVAISAPLQGTVVSLEVEEGSETLAGAPVLVMEAMKMEHVVEAETSGIVRQLNVAVGDTVFEGHALAFLEPAAVDGPVLESDESIDLDEIRPDLSELIERKAKTLDESRPNAVAKRRKTGQRTVRENIDAVIDRGTFHEYGGLTLAARRRMMSMEDLIDQTPADGLVSGIGQVNGDSFSEDRSRAMIIAYDYTVLAGTQGKGNHDKQDRMFELAERMQLPVVLFAEGGGGRSMDSDSVGGASLELPTFHRFAKLSGLVPLVGVTSGRCFAGNAVLLGCCDVIIATENSSIGMAGPGDDRRRRARRLQTR